MKTYSISAAIVLASLLSFASSLSNLRKFTSPCVEIGYERTTSLHLLTGITDTYYGSGYHSYGPYSINLSALGYTNVTMNANSVPNRFKIYNSSNSLVYDSGWIGSASYSGPWGKSLSGAPTSAVKGLSGGQVYSLSVETSTNGQTSDSWDAFW